MKILILFTFFVIAILTVQGPAPPVWPVTFTQEFVQGDSKSRVYESGKLWYDFKNNRQRTDFSGSAFQTICLALAQDPKAKCSLITVNDTLYVSLNDQAKCCNCCTKAQGCDTLIPRDWLKDFQYSGEADLSGATFYRWTLQGENYYATEDAARVPRRIDEGSFALDFIMNTYSTDNIDNSVFSVSNSCNTPCPRSTGCFPGSFEQTAGQKSWRGTIFNKRNFRPRSIKNLSQ